MFFEDVDKNLGANRGIADAYLYMIQLNYDNISCLPVRLIDRDVDEKDILEELVDDSDPNVKMLLVTVTRMDTVGSLISKNLQLPTTT